MLSNQHHVRPILFPYESTNKASGEDLNVRNFFLEKEIAFSAKVLALQLLERSVLLVFVLFYAKTKCPIHSSFRRRKNAHMDVLTCINITDMFPDAFMCLVLCLCDLCIFLHIVL